VTARGFTLIEVIVAMAVISIGVLAVTGLQHRSLELAGSSRAAQQLLAFTETELALQKQRASSGATADGCLSKPLPTGTTCAVIWTPCTLSARVLTCSALATDPVAVHVQVTTTGPRGASLDLWALAVKDR
jgi:prepilin-type N-terminal cleavage/methylation domain-containing protein